MSKFELQLASVSLHLRPSKISTDPELSGQLYTALTGSTDADEQNGSDDDPTRFRPVKVKINEDRLEIEWDPWGVTVTAESDQSAESRLGLIQDVVTEIDKIAPIGDVTYYRFSCHWIIGVQSTNFPDMNQLYMKRMIQPHSFFDNAYDSSVLTDHRVDDLHIYQQSGPMEPRQFRRYVSFPHDVPDLFMFLKLDVTPVDDNPTLYSRHVLSQLLGRSYEQCQQMSVRFSKIWGESEAT